MKKWFISFFLPSFHPLLFFPISFGGTNKNGSQWPPTLAACVFKEPCEEGVFTRTPPPRTTGG